MVEPTNNDPPMNPAAATATKTTATKRFAVLAAVLILALVALILDLVLAPVDEAKVQRLTVDATQTAPVAEIELVFAYGSQFSTVEPIGMQCTLESGIVEFDVTKNDETPNTYLVQASCPEEDTESHASMVWNVLVSHDMTLSELLETGVCQIQVRVTLGRVVPVQHTVNLALKDFTEQENEDEQEGEDGANASSIQPFVEVKHVSMDSLELGLGVAADPFAQSTMPETVEFLLPAFTIDAQPTHTTGAKILMDAVNATFECNTEFNDDVASLTLVSRDGETPFYRPLLDLFVTTEVETTIFVTVDGDGSFLETFLGQDHTFSVEHGHEELDIGYNPHATRKTRETFEDAVTDCMKVKDDSGAFNMGMCVLLEYGGSFTLVTNMAMYDFGALTATEIMWEDKPGDAIQINATSLVEVADSGDTLDVSSSLVFGWDPDDILIDFSMTNEGTWRPFEAVLLANGAIVGDVFNMTFEEVTLLVEGSGMDGASGYFVVDGDSVTWNGRLDHGDDLVALEGGVSLDDPEDWVLQVGSNCIWDDQDIWDASVSVVSDSDEYGDSWNLTLVVSEDVSGYLSNGWISMGENDTEVLFTHDDNVLSIASSRSTDGPEEFVFSSRSNCTWNGEDKWNSEFQIVWDLHDFLDNGNLTVVYSEAVSDLNMFTAVEIYDHDLWTLELTDFAIEKKDVQYIDSGLTFVLNRDNSTLSFDFEDEGKLDFDVALRLSWNFTDFYIVRIDEGVISSGTRVLLEVLQASLFEEGGGFGELNLDLKMPSAERQFRAGVGYSYEDVFDAQMTEAVLFWQDETFTNITGRLALDFMESFDLQLVDPTYLELDADLAVHWFNDEYDEYFENGGGSDYAEYGIVIDKAALHVGSEDYMDTTGTVTIIQTYEYQFSPSWEDTDRSTMVVQMASADTANLQLGVDMAREYLNLWNETHYISHSQTMLDQLRLGWNVDSNGWILNSYGFVKNNDVDRSFEMSLEDTGSLDFGVAWATRRYDSVVTETGWEDGLNLDRIFLRMGATEYINMSASVEIFDNYDVEDETTVLDFQAISSETANLQVAIGMNMTMYDGGMAMLCDHMSLGWKDRMFIEAPVVVSPMSSTKSSEFKDISMKLLGMTKEMSSEATAVYEETMKSFYENHFNSISHRHLLATGVVTNFVTTVNVTGQQLDDQGNLVTYDQTVSYLTTNDETEATTVWDMVVAPLTHEEAVAELLELLAEADEDFASVSNIASLDSELDEDAANLNRGLGAVMWWVILLSVAVFTM